MVDTLVVIPLEEQYLQRVVQIHRDGLGDTFNSRLGDDHLYFMYTTMAQQDESYIGVALLGKRPVGIVSGTLDVEKTKNKLLRSLKLQQLVNIVLKLMLHPILLYEWWKGNIISKEVSYEGTIVQPTLTAIAVDPNFQGKGIGKMLVYQLEVFFTKRGIQYYRLDTRQENITANEFYKSLGFQKAEVREDSIIYIKKIKHE